MVKNNSLPPVFRKKDIQDKLEKVCQDYDVLSLALFGSFVNGKPTLRSDVDLLVEFRNRQEKGLLHLIRAERAMRGVFKRKVDLVTQGSLSPYFRKGVLKSMRVIYERR